MITTTNLFSESEVLKEGTNKWKFRISKKLSEEVKTDENGGEENFYTIQTFLLPEVFTGTEAEAQAYIIENYDSLINEYCEKENHEIEIAALREELAQKQKWLTDHDYIGTKIATGRSTPEEYTEEIETMAQYAERISEIRQLLSAE